MNKRAPTPPQQVDTHPETKKHVKVGVADDKSSKAASKEPDGRTAQDKDGNEEQSKAKAGR